ncbi:hypothetical protein KTS45_02700 [Halomicroarcula limicola]|uniref:Halobacterial output domain-containing protein n=1 Tax=Haloarcula limicola TaxID=1429915 RepID=A0A8J8C5T6_9EURY|nr:HalOD1 output domain-containing protein [Halomicroarcula limicola]MBV0923098.1 hypothetical protein [Halomicroarcula limicola]
MNGNDSGHPEQAQAWELPGGELADADAAKPTYDPMTDTYTTTVSFADVSPSIAVAEALATVRHCETTALSPLYDEIDTDALDAIITGSGDSVSVTATVDGFEIVVTSGGKIEISPPE